MAEIEPTIKLTEEQVEFFCREGYLAVDRITTDEEVERMRVAYDELFERRAGREDGLEYDLAGTDEENAEATLPQMLEPRNHSEALRDTLFEANAKAMTQQLLEGQARSLTELVPTAEEVVDLGVHAILKPAHIGSETPWHQDEAYWDPGCNYLGLSVWLPLQDATVENGCMQFIPGTHTWEVMPHHHVDDDPRIEALIVDDGVIDTSQAVACPLPPGGATFHTCRTFHYSGPNRSEQPRRAFVLTANMPMPPRQVRRDFYWQQEKQTNAGKRRAEAARRQAEAEKS